MDVGRSIEERAEMLEDTSLSMDFSWKELLDLSYYMNTKRFTQGATIFKEGDREIFMAVVAKGEVSVLKKDEHMEMKHVTAIGKGKVIGEMSMIDGNPRSATAVAATDTTLVTLSKEGMHQLLKEKPYVGIKMLQKIAFSMSQRLRQTTGILVDYLEKES